MPFLPRVVDSPGRITYEEYADTLDGADTQEYRFKRHKRRAQHTLLSQVQWALDEAVGIKRDKRSRITAVKPKFERPEGSIPYGTLQPHPGRRGVLLVDEGFPQFLFESGVEKPDAILLAASSVIAYASVANWIGRLRTDQRKSVSGYAIRSESLPFLPARWDPQDYAPNQLYHSQSLHVLTHRAAARVALDAVGLSSLTTTQEQLPVHIAALTDPLNDRQLLNLHASAGK